MYHILVELGIPKKLARLLKASLEGSKGRVKVNGALSDTFEIFDGLKQGDGISPLCFNLVLEYIVRKAQENRQSDAPNSIPEILAYADDVDILGENEKSIVDLASAFIKEAKTAGLEVSEGKTKYMVMERKRKQTGRVGNTNQGSLKIDGFEFEKVDNFKYLGTTINEKNATNEEIRKRLQSGNACFWAVNKLLKSRVLSRKIKIRIYKTIIMPVVLYGCETWSLTKQQENNLSVFENKVLRKIFGAKQDEQSGEWRKLHNAELRELYQDPDINRVIKSRRLNWAGKAARMAEDRIVSKVLYYAPKKKRGRGRPRRRWEDNVKSDLKELGHNPASWMREAQGESTWQSWVDEAMNFRVPIYELDD